MLAWAPVCELHYVEELTDQIIFWVNLWTLSWCHQPNFIHILLLLIMHTYYFVKVLLTINPRTPKVKIHLRTPRGGGGVGTTPPWILVFPWEFFENITHGYVFGVKESNGDNEKILSLLHDLENQGQTLFWMTFVISGCKRGTDLILVSILTFLGSEMSKQLK